MKTDDIISQDIDIVTDDNWTLKVNLFAPDNINKPVNKIKSVIIVLPAMGSHSRPARFMAAALAGLGHAVLTADLRGHGKSLPLPKRGIDYGFDDFLRQDIPAILAKIAALYPGVPVFVIGHSLGGMLGGIYAAENPGVLAGVITLAAGNLSLKHVSLGSLSVLCPFI